MKKDFLLSFLVIFLFAIMCIEYIMIFEFFYIDYKNKISQSEEFDKAPVTNIDEKPFNSVCYVFAMYKDGTYNQGSGTLIASNQVLTAAHVVYDVENNCYASEVLVIAGYNGLGENFDINSASSSLNITVPEQWMNEKNRKWDIALIEVDRNYNNYQPYRFYDQYKSTIGLKVTSVGYPAEGNERMYYDTEHVVDASDNFLILNNELNHGDSGGPIFDSENCLIGVISSLQVSSTGHKDYIAVRINSEINDYIQKYLKQHGVKIVVVKQ